MEMVKQHCIMKANQMGKLTEAKALMGKPGCFTPKNKCDTCPYRDECADADGKPYRIPYHPYYRDPVTRHYRDPVTMPEIWMRSE